MVSIIPLIRNEVMKIWKKKRFFVILIILAVLIPIFTYAQYKTAVNLKEQIGTSDWRISAQERVNDYTNRLNSPRVLPEWKDYIKIQIQILQYHIDHNIDPQSPSGVTFAKEFLRNAVSLFLPLLILVLASDMISSEHTQGTIKILLTRPVQRWKVLASKLIALLLYVSMTLFALMVMSYLISGVVFGYGGWYAPVLTGFQINGAAVDTSGVQLVEQWKFVLMELGLAWFSCVVVAALALMISILVRSTAASMGMMLALLIAGSILSNMAASWESAKYFFMVNLDTIIYLSGGKPPVEGMSLGFSLTVLSITALISLVVSFAVFTRKDILN